MSEGAEITVSEFAKQQGVNEKSLREKLRRAFPEHPYRTPWIVRKDSADYQRWVTLAAEIHAWWTPKQ